MKINYTIRAPEKKDLQTISNFRALVGEDRSYFRRYKTSEYYRWKYFQNPIHRSCVRIAEDKSEMIGIVASTFKRLKINNNIILGAELGDLFTNQEYWRKGIFTKLTTEVCSQLENDGVHFIYVRPNENSFPGLVKMGFENIFYITPMLKPLNINNLWNRKFRNRLIANLGIIIEKIFVKTVFKITSLQKPSYLTLVKIPYFDESVDALWKNVSKKYQIVTVRDKEYLNWRYVDNPGDYVIYAAKNERTLLGYILVKCEMATSGLKYGYIVDILTEKGQTALMELLVLRAMDYFMKEKTDVVFTCVIKTSELHRVLKKLRFISYGKKFHFVIRTSGIKPSLLTQFKNPANWFFTMGDTDGI